MSAIDEKRISLVRNIYPNYKVVVLKACPGVIKLDPARMLKYLTADGAVQLIHIQVEIPAVLVDFCAGWGTGDGLTMFVSIIDEIFTKIRLHIQLAGLYVCSLKGSFHFTTSWSISSLANIPLGSYTCDDIFLFETMH